MAVYLFSCNYYPPSRCISDGVILLQTSCSSHTLWNLVCRVMSCVQRLQHSKKTEVTVLVLSTLVPFKFKGIPLVVASWLQWHVTIVMIVTDQLFIQKRSQLVLPNVASLPEAGLLTSASFQSLWQWFTWITSNTSFIQWSFSTAVV